MKVMVSVKYEWENTKYGLVFDRKRTEYESKGERKPEVEYCFCFIDLLLRNFSCFWCSALLVILRRSYSENNGDNFVGLRASWDGIQGAVMAAIWVNECQWMVMRPHQV